MPSKASIIFSIKELVETIKARQLNKFDANIGVSGKRGDGKSTLADKILLRFKGFKPKKHQVYSREDVIDLLKNQTFSFCWDDEAINSGYKRNFNVVAQQDLIKIITAYRDNFNIYASAIPFFYSLDKDLRELLFLHIHIIERGLAVIFMPLEDNIHQTDPWDTKNNAKLEEKWQRKKKDNPDFKFPYHKLSTFAGYLVFGDLTPKQRKLYEEIKKEKRRPAFLTDEEIAKQKEASFIDRLYNQMINGKLTKESLLHICLLEDKKQSSVSSRLNQMLTNKGIKKTLKEFINPTTKDREIQHTKEELLDIVPSIQ